MALIAAALTLASSAIANNLPGKLDMISTEMTFVTRPDLRPPQLIVEKLEPERLSSGYWFVAPYADLGAQNGAPGLCQVGPHIYDLEGQLIWSGACDVRNRNSFDFKVWEQNGAQGLSFVVEGQSNTLDMWHKAGTGLIMDDSYTIVDSVDPPDGVSQFNFHEFTRLADSNGTLMIHDDTSIMVDKETGQELRMSDYGFTELDSKGDVVFNWRAMDHVNINESTAVKPEALASETDWDWFHANSVDKDQNGDYLLSARHTDCIYKISSANGSILWRLGGINSTLSLQGFNFSRQHDARFAKITSNVDSKEVISFLNNGGDSHTHTSLTSAAYLVEIDTNQQAARLLRQWPRPNGKLGTYRGNVQFLNNGNVLVHWGDNGHVTEFDEQGAVLQEIHLAPTHLGNYRAYKFEFVGRPREAIVLKCSACSAVEGLNATVCYVSWNGATEVTHWEISDLRSDETEVPARAKKTGFETAVVMPGWHGFLVANALAANGSTLATSQPFVVDLPREASRQSFQEQHTVSNGRCLVGGSSTRDFVWMASIYILSVVILAQLLARYSPR